MTEACLCMSQTSEDGWNMTDTRAYKTNRFPFTCHISFYYPDGIILCFAYLKIKDYFNVYSRPAHLETEEQNHLL